MKYKLVSVEKVVEDKNCVSGIRHKLVCGHYVPASKYDLNFSKRRCYQCTLPSRPVAEKGEER